MLLLQGRPTTVGYVNGSLSLPFPFLLSLLFLIRGLPFILYPIFLRLIGKKGSRREEESRMYEYVRSVAYSSLQIRPPGQIRKPLSLLSPDEYCRHSPLSSSHYGKRAIQKLLLPLLRWQTKEYCIPKAIFAGRRRQQSTLYYVHDMNVRVHTYST